MKLALYTILGVLALVLVLGFIGTATSILSAPGRIIQETLKTNNILDNYEMYFDLNAGYDRRVADIQSQKLMLEGATGAELNRLKIELVGLQQTCRDLVTRYNAASEKANRSLFKANNLPEQLDLTTCN